MSSACRILQPSGLGSSSSPVALNLSVGSMFAVRRPAGDGHCVNGTCRGRWPRCFVIVVPLSRLAAGLLITRLNIQPLSSRSAGLAHMYRGFARFMRPGAHKDLATRRVLKPCATWPTGYNCSVCPCRSFYCDHAVISCGSCCTARYDGRFDPSRFGRTGAARAFSRHQHPAGHRRAATYRGAVVGVSGILFAFYTNSIFPSNHGQLYELYGIAAAVLAGAVCVAAKAPSSASSSAPPSCRCCKTW